MSGALLVSDRTFLGSDDSWLQREGYTRWSPMVFGVIGIRALILYKLVICCIYTYCFVVHVFPATPPFRDGISTKCYRGYDCPLNKCKHV